MCANHLACLYSRLLKFCLVFNEINILFHFQLSPLKETPFEVPNSQRSFTVKGLDPYKNYTFAVSAKNSLGSSVNRAVLDVTTLGTSKLPVNWPLAVQYSSFSSFSGYQQLYLVHIN